MDGHLNKLIICEGNLSLLVNINTAVFFFFFEVNIRDFSGG